MKTTFWLKIVIVAAFAVFAAGCAGWVARETRHANSLYNYLYAGQSGHLDAETIPVLSLPLRVGIAFVPAGQSNGRFGNFPIDDPDFSENQRLGLLKQIGDQFKSYPFVKSIEVVPTAYLTPQGGFANLEQIRTMYGVDVVALLSYDQVQFTDEGLLSLTYWTIVGAYVIQGEKNDTQTMLDGAVYDIASRKLLFRAPGLSHVHGSATRVNLSEQLRGDRERGFNEAATNLVASLKVQLEDFRQRIKNAPAEYKVIHKPGYTGASGIGGVEVVVACLIGACFLWTHRICRV
jgi:rhombotail lipoprotein